MGVLELVFDDSAVSRIELNSIDILEIDIKLILDVDRRRLTFYRLHGDIAVP